MDRGLEEDWMWSNQQQCSDDQSGDDDDGDKDDDDDDDKDDDSRRRMRHCTGSFWTKEPIESLKNYSLAISDNLSRDPLDEYQAWRCIGQIPDLEGWRRKNARNDWQVDWNLTTW